MSSNSVPEAGKGVRLFPGDALRLDRKYGISTAAMAQALERSPVVLTVTGTGWGEQDSESFVRFHFQCPLGVFVSTLRQVEMDRDVADLVHSAHSRLTLYRRNLQSFLLRPAGPAHAAVNDLITNGIFIQGAEGGGQEDGTATVQIWASPAWTILRSEIADRPGRTRLPANRAGVSPAAFQRAAEELLPDAQLEDIRARAAELMRWP